MIGKKVGRSSGFKGRIEYCINDKHEGIRGELVGISDSLQMAMNSETEVNISMANEMMQSQANLNSRVKKPCWHQIFSFPHNERPSNEILATISEEFAEEFGFNQWLSIKHDDKQHLHIHFIGNIVDENGKVSVKDSNDHYRIVDFAHKMEEKHHLTPTEGIREDKKDSLKNDHVQKIKKFIDLGIQNPKVKNLEDLQKSLIKVGIKSFTGRGITFVDKSTGVKTKGSDLGRDYSKQKIEERIQEQVQIRQLESEHISKKSEDELKEEGQGNLLKEKEQFEKVNTLKIKTPQSGHASVNDAELAKDIRSKEEKTKDQQRRMGGMSL